MWRSRLCSWWLECDWNCTSFGRKYALFLYVSKGSVRIWIRWGCVIDSCIHQKGNGDLRNTVWCLSLFIFSYTLVWFILSSSAWLYKVGDLMMIQEFGDKYESNQTSRFSKFQSFGSQTDPWKTYQKPNICVWKMNQSIRNRPEGNQNPSKTWWTLTDPNRERTPRVLAA